MSANRESGMKSQLERVAEDSQYQLAREWRTKPDARVVVPGLESQTANEQRLILRPLALEPLLSADSPLLSLETAVLVPASADAISSHCHNVSGPAST